MPSTRGAVRARSITTRRSPNAVPAQRPSSVIHTRAMPVRASWKNTPSTTMGDSEGKGEAGVFMALSSGSLERRIVVQRGDRRTPQQLHRQRGGAAHAADHVVD